MQSVEGKWETRMANLGGIKVGCVETAPSLKKYWGFFFFGVRGRSVHRLASTPWIFKTILLLEGSEQERMI